MREHFKVKKKGSKYRTLRDTRVSHTLKEWYEQQIDTKTMLNAVENENAANTVIFIRHTDNTKRLTKPYISTY